MSGTTTSYNGLETTERIGDTLHHRPVQEGDWLFIPGMMTVGRIEKSDTPLFEEQGFITLFVPADGGQHSFKPDELQSLSAPFNSYYPLYEVGNMVVCNRRRKDFPQVYDPEYDDFFTLTDSDVGLVVEASPFHVKVKFGCICSREVTGYGSEPSHTEYYTAVRTGYDSASDMLLWDDDATEEQKAGEKLESCHVHIDPTDFDGDTLIFVLRSEVKAAGDKRTYVYEAETLERVMWCQGCGVLLNSESDYMQSDDEFSLHVLKGETPLERCEGCHESYTSAYSFKVMGDEEGEYTHAICHYTSDVEDASQIVHDFISAWDFNDQCFLPNHTLNFLNLRDQYDWDSTTESNFESLYQLINKWHHDHPASSCRFSILDVDGGSKYLIRRTEICQFAAWLQWMEKHGKMHHSAAYFLSDFMPTKQQIAASFRTGECPKFAGDPLPDPALRSGVVTGRDLKRFSACESQRNMFRTTFPDGCVINVKNVQLAKNVGLNLDWFIERAFTLEQKCMYRKWLSVLGSRSEAFVKAYWYPDQPPEESECATTII